MKKRTTRKARQAFPNCGGLKRDGSGDLCTRPAGWGTDHPGTGKCKLHGGAALIKHGLHSEVMTVSLFDRIAQHAQNPDPLNLLPELAKLRGLTDDLMERWESIYGVDGALLAWHESFQVRLGKDGEEIPTAPKPRQLIDFSSLGTLLDQIGKMADRIHKHRMDESLTMESLDRILTLYGEGVANAIDRTALDKESTAQLIENIRDEWGKITVESRR
jgi:hypothetical protein